MLEEDGLGVFQFFLCKLDVGLSIIHVISCGSYTVQTLLSGWFDDAIKSFLLARSTVSRELSK